MSSMKRNLGWFVLLLSLISVAACKIDMEQEIWLNKNNSGKAAIKVALNIAMGYDAASMDSLDLGQNNAMAELAERANNTEGVVVTRYDTATDHSDEEMNYIYYLDFTFKDLNGLRSVLCVDPNSGMAIKKTWRGKLLTMDARQFNLQMEGSEEDMEYFSFLDMNLTTIVNLPKKAKRIDKSGYGTKLDKQVIWKTTIDEDWFAEDSVPLSVLF